MYKCSKSSKSSHGVFLEVTASTLHPHIRLRSGGVEKEVQASLGGTRVTHMRTASESRWTLPGQRTAVEALWILPDVLVGMDIQRQLRVSKAFG